jgi:excisionase family DNA binding protein
LYVSCIVVFSQGGSGSCLKNGSRGRRRSKISTYPYLERFGENLKTLRQALEELESSLIEFEESLHGESQVRPVERKGLELLSITDVCQELGMGKSWVYRRIQSGEIPSVKLGRNIKVRREDLEGYLEAQRYQPTASEG